MPSIVPSTPATIRIVPNWRRSPRSSASTGVVVVMSLMLGPGGVSGSHTARVIIDLAGCSIQEGVAAPLGRAPAACAGDAGAGTARAPVADAAVGAPVDRHRERGLQQRQRLRRLARVHVARAGLRPPAGDRQQRGVEPPRQARHLRVRLGVAGEVDALDDEAHAAGTAPRDRGCGGRRGRRAPPRSAPRRARASRRRRACAPRGGSHAASGPRPCGATTSSLRVEPAQRGLVEMVVMPVREQDRVEPADVAGHARLALQVHDARAQQRVGDQARAPELEQHGGVPEPGHHVGHRRPIVARGTARRFTPRG